MEHAEITRPMFASRTHTTIWLAIAIICSSLTGCMRLRLPAIDPTGERLFLPCPNSTTLNNFGDCLPTPAFTDPPPPPPCLAGAGLPPVIPQQTAPEVCVDDCFSGPKAVLHDKCIDLKKLCHLPDRGNRGKILLNHRKIIAPVGGEVILLAGVCGNDGFLMTGEPLEWMLTPDSVGHFIEVGDDKENPLHRLVARNKVKKLSGDFARGRTSTKSALITRGNLRRDDDVPVRKGETWLTISSPSEGISRVTVMAPDSDCWDQRKTTATIYWVDVNWVAPTPVNLPAGQQAQLITQVTRGENLAATNWKVRYEVLNPEVAGFDIGTPNLSPVVESTVNDQGEARALIRPLDINAPGTAQVQFTIIRPAGLDESLPEMTLGSGLTTVTWSAPQLRLRAGASPFVTAGEEFPISINIANAGDREANNVILQTELPLGLELDSVWFVNADGSRDPAQYQRVDPRVVFNIGTLPAQQQLDIEMRARAQASFRMDFQAADGSGLTAQDNVDVTVIQRNLDVQITPRAGSERVQVGQDAIFDITVSNIGNRPISGVVVEAIGDQGLISIAQDVGEWRNRIVSRMQQDLRPGDPFTVSASFRVQEPGQRCVQINVTGDQSNDGRPQQRASDKACIVGTAPPPPNPFVSARIEAGNAAIPQGQNRIVDFVISNSGDAPLSDVDVFINYDPALTPINVTPGVDVLQDRLEASVRITNLAPRQLLPIQIEFRADGNVGPARIDMAVRSAQNARDTAEVTLQITEPAAQPTPPPATAPTNPVPSSPAPISPPNSSAAPSPIPAPGSSPPVGSGLGELQIRIAPRNTSAYVGDSILYDLLITNARNVPDQDVVVEIFRPVGARIEGIQHTQFDGDPVESISPDGIVRLRPIRQIRAGEPIQYTIEMKSNLPQNMTVRVQARSNLTPTPVVDETRVEVLAR